MLQTLTRRKHFLKGLLGLALLFFSAGANAQGAGGAISFPATSANEHINLGTGLSTALATSNFTIEMWVNFNSFNADEPIIGNKDWNNGANIGWALTRSSKQGVTSTYITTPITANTLWFNMTPSGGTRRDWHISIPNLNMINNWVHVAITVDRKGNIAFFFNGQPATIAAYAQNGTNSWTTITSAIAIDSNKSINGTLPIRLGQDGTGTYSPRYSGKLDDVRVWNTVRTVADIRNNMCHKLTGNEAGLLSYYRLDETTGTVATNSATATTGTYDGTLTNTPARITSAAPIGDTSANIYATSLAAQSLALNSQNHGNLSLQNLGGSLKGMQIYRVDAAPNTYGTITAPNANNVYYGIFPVDTGATAATYDAQYDFTNFPAALTYSGSIDLYGRYSTDSAWAGANALKTISTHLFNLTATSKRKELIIGNFSNATTCNTPTTLGAGNLATSSATLSWTSGGANRWNIVYGTGSFTPATGTRINNITATTYNLTGLSQNTTYQFYVQDTCVNLLGSSAWAGPFSFTTLKDYSYFGAGYAMSFPGTAANEHVNLGTALSAAVDTVNFTMEMWVNFNKFNDDEAFIANKNWNNGANIGFSWGHSNKSNVPVNSLWFNMQFTGGNRKDWHITIPGLNLLKTWNHVAVTIDRKGMISFYINGIPATVAAYALNGSNSFTTVNMDISVDSNRSIKGTLPVRIGQDGTGTYGVKFNGQMDEVRIWSTVRTQTQIRDYMCRKLPVNTPGLFSYYRFDEATGTVANNLATATSGTFNGTLTNTPLRVISAAPMGDTSVYAYNTNLTATSIALASAQYGKLTVDSLINTFAGIQLYRVDTIPNTTNGVSGAGNTKAYFGIFPVDTASATTSNPASRFRINYDYSNYPAAVAASANLHLYNRSAADVTPWTSVVAVNQTATNQLVARAQLKRKEIIAGDFTAGSCAQPTGFSLDSISNTFARLSWSSSAVKWNVQYGLQGFALGTGTIDTVNTLTKDGISNLIGETYYDAYIRTRCGNDSSAWVGPISFKTLEQCPAPQSLTVTYLGGDSVRISWNNSAGASVYNLQWGQQGFTLGAGIPINNVSGTTYVLAGLSNTQTYDIYIQDTCTAGGMSKWYGPVTFQANGTVPPPPPTSVSNISNSGNLFFAFPNPASGFVTVDGDKTNTGTTAQISIVNLQGSIIRVIRDARLPYRMATNDLANGIYLLQCATANARGQFKLTIQQ